MTTILRARRLVKSVAGRAILRDARFAVRQGEVTALVAAPGAGRTTLLRCLAMLDPIDSGTIEFGGHVIVDATAPVTGRRWWRGRRRRVRCNLDNVRRQIGFVFQTGNLCVNRTVLRNMIEGPVHVLNWKRSEAIEGATELLGILDAADLADVYPLDLPPVRRRLAAIARAAMMRPDLLLVDDVCAGLEPEDRATLVRAVQAIHEIRNLAVVFATRDESFMRESAHRVCTLADGTITEVATGIARGDAPAEELPEEPAPMRVAAAAGTQRR
jgi:polar amino acid transport system ATP-binding protein